MANAGVEQEPVGAPLEYEDIANAYLTSRMWAAAALALGAAVFAVLYGWGEMLVVVVGGGLTSAHSAFLRRARAASPEPILYLDLAIIALGGAAVRLVPAAFSAPALMLSTVAFLTLDRGRLLRFLAVAGAVVTLAALASLTPPAALPVGGVVAVAALASAIFILEAFGVLSSARRALGERRLYHEGVSRVLEAAADALVMVRPDGTVGLANEAAVALLTGRDELVGRPISVVRGRIFDSGGTLVAPGEETSTKVLGGLRVEANERVIETTDGRRVVAVVKGVPLTAGDGTVLGAVLSFSDVTGLRHLAGELERRNAELEHLQRSRMELVASVSHELRTPLTGVVGLASELAGGGFGEAEAAELAGIIAEESRELAAIVEDLLVAARVEAGELAVEAVPIDVAAEAHWVLERLGSPDRLQATGTVTGYADPVRFHQVLRNLYTNARRYGGEKITVRVGRLDGFAVVEVADDGPGVPEDRRELIFEPFERAGRANPGSVGLGLTVSRRLARMMGGDLVYRHDGVESVFELTLPLAPEQA